MGEASLEKTNYKFRNSVISRKGQKKPKSGEPNAPKWKNPKKTGNIIKSEPQED